MKKKSDYCLLQLGLLLLRLSVLVTYSYMSLYCPNSSLSFEVKCGKKNSFICLFLHTHKNNNNLCHVFIKKKKKKKKNNNHPFAILFFQAQSRLGGSVAVVDVNLDGADDLAVGAPAFVMTFSGNAGPLDYQVRVLFSCWNSSVYKCFWSQNYIFCIVVLWRWISFDEWIHVFGCWLGGIGDQLLTKLILPSSEKGSTLKGKNLLPFGANSLL